MKTYIFILLNNILCIGGFAYLVDQRGWNPWWMAFGLALCHWTKSDSKKEDDEKKDITKETDPETRNVLP